MSKIRVFNPPQDDEFYTIMGRFFANREMIKELDNQLYNPENATWILYIESKEVKGFISVEHKKKYDYIDNFYVLEKFRGADIGNTLLDKAVSISGEKIRLITRNEIAFNMFNSRGFETFRKNGRYSYMEKN